MADKRIPTAAIRAAWLDQDVPARVAAEAVGLSRMGLWKRSRSAGLPARKAGRKVVEPSDPALFRAMWAAGVLRDEIAAACGLRANAVERIRRRYGLKPRGGWWGSRITGRDFAMHEAARREQAALRASGLVDGTPEASQGVR